MKTALAQIVSWIVAIAVPIALIGLAVRLVLLPLFPQIEYRMPYFPADDYGFTTEQRIHWATYAWDYLVTGADISYLGDLQFEDGKPLFNERGEPYAGCQACGAGDVHGLVRGTHHPGAECPVGMARGGQMKALRRGVNRGGVGHDRAGGADRIDRSDRNCHGPGRVLELLRLVP